MWRGGIKGRESGTSRSMDRPTTKMYGRELDVDDLPLHLYAHIAGISARRHCEINQCVFWSVLIA